MVSLASLINIISEQSYTAALLPQRCLRKRLNTNNCTLCLDSCHSGALSLKGREIVLDESCCTGCMACVSACPQDALTAECDPVELFDSLHDKSNGNVLVSCYRQKQLQPEEITVPCLGIFSKPILAAIGLGNGGSVTFNMAGCSDCSNSYASHIFRTNCNEVIGALSDILVSELVITGSCEHIERLKADRRSYLATVRKSFSKATKKCIATDTNIVELEAKHSRRVPYKTQLIRNLIQSVEAESRMPLLTLFGHSLTVDDNCSLCPLCKGICPTGALSIKRNEKGKELFFSQLNCSGCGLCVEFCKKKALSFEQHPFDIVDGDTLRLKG
jgi:ferredoxin